MLTWTEQQWKGPMSGTRLEGGAGMLQEGEQGREVHPTERFNCSPRAECKRVQDADH